MKDKKNVKITIKQGKKGVKEEKGDLFDDVYGKNEMDRLQKGIVEWLIGEGIITETSIDEVEVSLEADEIYRRVKIINKLDDEIKRKQAFLKKIMAEIGKRQCKQPTTDQLFDYCRRLVMVSKGKTK